MFNIEKLVKNIIECGYDELKNYSFPKNELFGLIIKINNVKYEFLLNLKDNTDKLLVLGSGARDINQTIENKHRPYFNRWSWKFNEEISTIFYNDPTTYLADNLTAGWGLGTLNDWYLEKISKIIIEIAYNLNINHDHIFFYGSSAGGFLSLALATLIRESVAIAEIPQLNLRNYPPYNILNLEKICLGNIEEEVIIKKHMYKLDLIELFKFKNYVPNCYLILDCSCDSDYNNNYLPFFNRLNELPFSENSFNHIYIRIDAKNKGHKALDYNSASKLLDDIILKDNGEKIKNINTEVEYFKKNNKIIKKLLTPIAYLYLIYKSKPSEIRINLKLYKVLKSSELFDIGYYLNKYPDIVKSKWYKYFSPELHYVCNGFDEKRKINNKDYSKKSRKEFLKDVKNK